MHCSYDALISSIYTSYFLTLYAVCRIMKYNDLAEHILLAHIHMYDGHLDSL